MKIALMFPGQGSQYSGMGSAMSAHFPLAKRIFEEADETLGYSLSKLCFDGTPEELAQTKHTQPAIFTVNHICSQVLLMSDVNAKVAMGHSLGEYNALVAAGVIPFHEALSLVEMRAQLMQTQAELKPGAMAAILGLADADVEKAIEGLDATIANYNCPGQVVISGRVAAIDEAILRLSPTAKRVVKLDVGGAFHTSLMAEAADSLIGSIDKVDFNKPMMPVASNATGKFTVDPGHLKESLKIQMTSPVKWRQALEEALAHGLDTFIEAGPGKVLSGLVKRTARDMPNVTTYNVEDPASLEKTLHSLTNPGGGF